MKLINYRGGIARFYLPSSWVEEYEPAGGGTFYDDKPDSGTLRINVITAEKQARDSEPAESVDELIADISETKAVKQLPGGAAIAHSVQTGEEDGQDLLFNVWHIGVPVTLTSVRIITFTYTILASQEADPEVQKEIAMLNRSISAGEYSSERGASGDQVHD